jgi:hypothetical protein
MVPPGISGKISSIEKGKFTVEEEIAVIKDKDGNDMNVYNYSEREYGNSFLLGDEGEQLCPGHPHIWEENGKFYLGYDYILEKEAPEEFDHMAIRRLYWVNGWPTIWTPVRVSFNADDFPDAIGNNLGVSFQNTGETESVLAIDNTSITVSTPADLDQIKQTKLPVEFQLFQNSPNPFNPVTVIGYQLPTVGDVELTVYNYLGQQLEILVKKTQSAGIHKVIWNASGYTSGVYYYRISAGDYVETRKCILIK